MLSPAVAASVARVPLSFGLDNSFPFVFTGPMSLTWIHTHRSKKHLEHVALLRQVLEEEEAALAGGAGAARSDSQSDMENTSEADAPDRDGGAAEAKPGRGGSKAAKKKRRRQQQRMQVPAEEDEDDTDGAIIIPSTDGPSHTILLCVFINHGIGTWGTLRSITRPHTLHNIKTRMPMQCPPATLCRPGGGLGGSFTAWRPSK